MPRILFIDKEDRSRALLQCRLKADGEKIKFAPSLEAAWEKLSSRKFDLILWNAVNDPAAEINLQETLKLLSTKVSGSRIIVFNKSPAFSPQLCCGNIQMENLPANQEDLLALVQSNLPVKFASEQSSSTADKFSLPIEFEGIIAVSLPMGAVLRRAIEAANVDMPVLITGETGTGKDLIAAAIHKRSRRKDNPYIIVNTGAMSPQLIASEIFGHEKGAFTGAQDAHHGIFEQAHGGTVFSMKLLRWTKRLR